MNKKPWKKPQLVVHSDLKTVSEHCPDRADLKEIVKCSRCRNRHTKGERIAFPMKGIVGYNEVCPRCGCHSYYDFGKECLSFTPGKPEKERGFTHCDGDGEDRCKLCKFYKP